MGRDTFMAARRAVTILFLCLWTSCARSSSRTDAKTEDPRPEAVSADWMGEEKTTLSGCGSLEYGFHTLIPGPYQTDFDAELEGKAERYERLFHVFNCAATGLNADVVVKDPAYRQLVQEFAETRDGYDFEGFAGVSPLDAIDYHAKSTGLYAGMGLAADAFRYAVLRAENYPCDEVEQARDHLLAGLNALHIASTIAGKPGVIARSIARTDIPGDGQSAVVVPLFDEDGKPLPSEKNNGTWRKDGTGMYPDYVWEDSINHDQYIGWVTAYAVAWEVIEDDQDIPQAVKDRLVQDALPIALELPKVRESGHDLEIYDADGRRTLHGCLNEHNLDCKIYADQVYNGFHAIMALGIVAAWVFVTNEPELESYLNEELIAKRRLHEIARDYLSLVHMGYVTNYSNYNMAFAGAFLATRYLKHGEARAVVRDAVRLSLYDPPDVDRDPKEARYSYYDLVYAAAQAGQHALGTADDTPDPHAVSQGIETLREFHQAPYWNDQVYLCPDAKCDCDHPKVDNPACVALGGLKLTVLGCIGRNCDLITEEPIPMRLLGPSNYHWRSNPYIPNRDGDGTMLLPGVDFRVAYWLGRFVRTP